MLSIFPELLSFSLLGIFIIRAVIGLTLILISIQILFIKKNNLVENIKNKGVLFAKYSILLLGSVSLLSGAFMLVGFLVQISAIVSSYLFLNIMYLDSRSDNVLKQSRMFYIIMSLISISFLFIGPGIFSVDLPL